MTQMSPDAIAPDTAQIATLAQEAVAALPDIFRQAASLVALRVEDLADRDILDALDIADPYDLTGLYDGIPLTEKSFAGQALQPDQIWLFRLPILEEWIDRGDVSLRELVSHVLVHELAHHFGWSDDDIARIDPWWE